MDREDFNSAHIQQLIGYDFKNERLLLQAFTRRSFSQENPSYENNEVLEFYGDTALNFYVTRSLSLDFGKIQEKQFISEKDEGELTKIRSWNVNKQKLSHCIEILGLEKYLLLGTSDIKNEVWKSESVKEDLFESIVGAVAIDSEWNSDSIKDVCQNLFSISDFSENYVALLEEECKKHGWEKPQIWDSNYFNRMTYRPFEATEFIRTHINPFYGTNFFSEREKFSFRIRNLRSIVSDFNPKCSSTKTKAIMLSAKNYYEWLLRRDKIKDSIGAINENLAVNQLHELYQKGLISEPVYNFSESHDKDGNPIWKCFCKLNEAEYPFEAENSSKKKVKQEVSAQALFFLLGSEISLNKSVENK